MYTNLFIFRRAKDDGFYQNDMKCEKIIELEGLTALNYGFDVVYDSFKVVGTAVLSEDKETAFILENEDDYDYYSEENSSNRFKGHLMVDKYEFIYRVEESFFRMFDLEVYNEWLEDDNAAFDDEDEWFRKQLSSSSKVLKTLDFENYYYYVSDSNYVKHL